MIEMIPFHKEGLSAVLLFIDIQFTDGDGEVYVLPLAHISLEAAKDLFEKYPRSALARVEDLASNAQGVLVDGLHQQEFCLMLLKMISGRAIVRGKSGKDDGGSRTGIQSPATGRRDAFRGFPAEG